MSSRKEERNSVRVEGGQGTGLRTAIGLLKRVRVIRMMLVAGFKHHSGRMSAITQQQFGDHITSTLASESRLNSE